MELSQVILGPVVTEKAERLKAMGPCHTYSLEVHPKATKIDVKKALTRYYDVSIEKVRIVKVAGKSRMIQTGGSMEKRKAFKKALVSLAPKSKPLDLSTFELQA
jgi:large subunit ribosomal protein L23